MDEKVGVIGTGVTYFNKNNRKQRLEEMIFEASYNALDNAGVKREQIDGLVIAACDELDGRSISSMLTATPAGGYLKDEIKVTDEGAYAVFLGAMRVLAKDLEIALVVSWNKTSEGPIDNVMSMRWEPFFHRGLGLNHITSAALMANQYMEKYEISEKIPAMIVEKNINNGNDNPLIMEKRNLSFTQVLDSEVISWPIKKEETGPLVDTACAIVLASEKKCEELGVQPIWIEGMGSAIDTYYIGDRDLSSLEALKIAAQKAYLMAGINDPLNQLDVVELHDLTPYHELIAYEGLGFCKHGYASKLINDGVTYPGGRLPVNLSGGTLSANPFFCGGLIRFLEAYYQLKGNNDNYKKLNANTALAHSTNGFAAQGHVVFILRKGGLGLN